MRKLLSISAVVAAVLALTLGLLLLFRLVQFRSAVNQRQRREQTRGEESARVEIGHERRVHIAEGEIHRP